MTNIFPSILPDRDFVDERYTERELARMEWREIRRIAAAHPAEDVNGSMSRTEMEAALVGRRRV